MSRAAAAMLFALPMLAGCAQIRPPERLPGLTLVTYQPSTAGPYCFRGCTRAKLTVASDGRVWIEEGTKLEDLADIWRTERRRLQLPPERTAAFLDRLARFRPQGWRAVGEGDGCEDYLDHSPIYRISWSDPQREDELVVDFGCIAAEFVTMHVAIRTAPGDLGIEALKGRF